ncbi:hypothetical protein GCM10027280_22690 [Micromonospora polyrhachis]|uniref:Uncharacterized protein n=1 Tax=Micromonospora polyrhachis TaxID=1282883 RepID=A0A7W7WTD9_9ACTN|nr:hypothetical protein [Micromonospora polyrhachis]MBB4962597.1 hypothetical protein [Micromonospora polyrhachis]
MSRLTAGPNRRAAAEARTVAEAYVFLELSLPEGEGWVDYLRYTALDDLDDEHWLLRFDGPYEGDWYVAEVPVSKAGTQAAEESDELYGVDRSTLVDAGQWYVIESANAGMAEAGLDRMGDEPPDEETYWSILNAWNGAAAAAREIEKFLPGGVDEVPETAFWTDLGRHVHEQRRDVFRRSRMVRDVTFYRERRDDFQRRFGSSFSTAAGEPATAPTVVPPTAVPTTAAAPLPARTYAEIHTYLDTHPCRCGSVEFSRDQMAVLTSDENGVVVGYSGPCDDCALPRDQVFRLPQRPGSLPGEPWRFSYPEDGPSELLDPGQWVAVSQAYAVLADEMLAALAMMADPEGEDNGAVGEPDPTEWEAVVTMLTMSVYALDEVVKFLPPGVEELPGSACWSANGHEVRRTSPEWFRRTYLAEQRFLRQQQLTALVERDGR